MCLSMARSCRGQCGLFNPTLLHLIANGSIPSLYLWLHRQGQGSIRSNPGDTLNDWISYRFTAWLTETSGFHQLSDWHVERFTASVDPSTAQGRHTQRDSPAKVKVTGRRRLSSDGRQCLIRAGAALHVNRPLRALTSHLRGGKSNYWAELTVAD